MEFETPQQVNGLVKKALPPQPYHLVKADSARLREVWPQVRRGCLAVKARSTRPEDAGNWTPEHVRAQIEFGLVGRSSCELWIISDEKGAMKGFLVTVISPCPYLSVPLSLLVWMAHTPRPIGGRNARAILSDLEDYARGLGLKYLDGYTARPEWAAWLQRYGRNYRSAVTLIRKDLWSE